MTNDFLNQGLDGSRAPAIELRHQLPAEHVKPLGCCLGGIPYLPMGIEWPTHRITDLPLTFIGQINFSEFPAKESSTFRLPTKGLLQFFMRHPDSFLTEGVDGESQDEHFLLWHASVNDQQWEKAEAGQTITPTRFQLKPALGLSYYAHAELMATQQFTASEGVDFYAQQPPAHQVCGSPKVVQYDPFESMTSKRQSWIAKLFHPSTRQEDTNEEWQLLWQIDSDPIVGLNWIDGGVVYLLIRSKDLQAGDFSKVHINLQTH
jgi:uncharacterized protein YwqG